MTMQAALRTILIASAMGLASIASAEVIPEGAEPATVRLTNHQSPVFNLQSSISVCRGIED